jgi:hypothetical protein
MPANLAHNLDQQTQKAKNETSGPPPTQRDYQETSQMAPRPQSQQLPPLEISQRQPNEDPPSSSVLGQPSSGLEAYLNDDAFPFINEIPPAVQQPGPQPVSNDTYNQTRYQPPRVDPYTASNAPPQSKAPKNDPYSTYNAPPAQPQYPPQQPLRDDRRPNSRPSSSQGRPVHSQPPPTVDYSRLPDQSAPQPAGRGSYQRPPPQEQYNYAPPPPPQPGRVSQSSRPTSQGVSNAPPQGSPPQKYSTGTHALSKINTDPIEIPVPSLPAIGNLTLELPSPSYSRPQDPPGRVSPRIPPINTNVVASVPQTVVAPMEYEWETEIDSQRDIAVRTGDPTTALAWAEKVYMYVSMSMEEIRREQAAVVANGGVAARPATPVYERGLREDCVHVVEKFSKMQHPKAVWSLSRLNLTLGLYAWDLV